jgi:23S rRNA (uracil1939-C5)-methyltransferase
LQKPERIPHIKNNKPRKTDNKPNALQGTLDVTIEKIVPNGYGLGFAENLTVFVSLAAVGDKVRVKINQIKGKTAFAEIVEIIEPSPDRTEPRCPYFGRCGGCDFQQLNYRAQLEAKVGIVRDCLSRIGKINYEREIPIIGSPHDYDYRSRAQWHVDTRKKKIGYFQRKSHDVIDAEVCPILIPELKEVLTELRETIVWDSFWSEMVEIEASTAGGEVSIYSTEIIEPDRRNFIFGKRRNVFSRRDELFSGQSVFNRTADRIGYKRRERNACS